MLMGGLAGVTPMSYSVSVSSGTPANWESSVE